MSTFVFIVIIICGSVALTVLGCVWMGTSYYEKKRGLRSGASDRELFTLQQQVSEIRKETDTLKNQIQELIKIAKGISE
ncbi:hypothetical protein JT359_04915 [Candidatus Poribacteria bacterium]|nr:hypothetical protein [Candidatus Poribacteria bacterium]